MIYEETFQIQNIVVDKYFAELTGAEVKLLIVIIRQTHGWVDQRTGRRKTRDWISHGQFMQKTGLSRRMISTVVQSLVAKGLIEITNQGGKPLANIVDRQGQVRLYYSPNLCTFRQEPVHFFPTTSAKSAHNKTNYTKLNNTKERVSPFRTNTMKQIGEILKLPRYQTLV